jgi:hypothetical protein
MRLLPLTSQLACIKIPTKFADKLQISGISKYERYSCYRAGILSGARFSNLFGANFLNRMLRVLLALVLQYCDIESTVTVGAALFARSEGLVSSVVMAVIP